MEEWIPAVAQPFAYVGRMFVIGRGPEFATAREIALKLLETCRIAAEPLTATDLGHGPVAALDPLFPVWGITSDDETVPAVLDAAARFHAAGATLVASGTAAARVADADYVVPVAPGAVAAARSAVLRDPRPAVRVNAGTGEGARPRPAERPHQSDARPLSAARIAATVRGQGPRSSVDRAAGS